MDRPTYVTVRLKPDDKFAFNPVLLAPEEGSFIKLGPALAIWQVAEVLRFNVDKPEEYTDVTVVPFDPHRVPFNEVVMEFPRVGSPMCEFIRSV